jgi:ComF family protein
VKTALEPSIDRILFRTAEAEVPATWSGAFSRNAEAALDILFPPHCVSCDSALAEKTNTSICRACAEKVRWFGADRCSRCGDAVGRGSGVVPECPTCHTHPPAYIKASCSVAGYMAGPLRDLILGLKFGQQLHLARNIGQLIAQRIKETGLIDGHVALVPAPLTRSSFASRGFNQAEEIANCVSRELNIPVEPHLLRKVRSTPPQATLTHEERRKNLKDAFACDPKVAQHYKGKGVVLIDDVITTCSTVSECARMLHAAGVGDVRAASLARG